MPGTTEDSVDKFLYPQDPMDIPRAIELIQAVASLCFLDKSQFDPGQQKTVNAIQLVGSLFHCLTQPFLNRDLNLIEQFVSLSKYSHMALALYRRNATSFMPGQLYHDTQTMVKGAFFYLARQTILDGSLPVLLMLCGDDRLENLFGRVRMQGAHNSAVDQGTLLHRFAAAMDLTRIMTVHPSWDVGHRRLNYSRLEHYDHLNPSSWKGNLRADSCVPADAWTEGRKQAELELCRHHVEINFEEIFNIPDVDMLRPLPGGKFPGHTEEPDRSILREVQVTNTTAMSPTDANEDIASTERSEGESIGLDDTLPEPPTSTVLQRYAGEDFLEEDNKKFYFASLLRIIFAPDFIAKSADRLRRVQTFSTKFLRTTSPDEDDTQLLDVELFTTGDSFIGLIRTGETVAAAVLQCVGIQQGSLNVSSVSAAELSLDSSNIKLIGQVLELIPSAYPSDIPYPSAIDDTDIFSSAPESSLTNPSLTMTWTGNYLKFYAVNAKKDKDTGGVLPSTNDVVTRSALLITIPSTLTRRLSGENVPINQLSDTEALCITTNGLTETWSFKLDDLRLNTTKLWDFVQDKLPKVLVSGPEYEGRFPYAGHNGVWCFGYIILIVLANRLKTPIV